MKKIILGLAVLGVAACSTPTQQSSVPLDMQAVAEYQQKVARGETKSEHWDLNQSDKRQKVKVVQVHHHPRIYPSVHYGYGWGRHHTGIGVGLGGF